MPLPTTATGLALKLHSRMFPIALILMGVYCLLTINSISCTQDSNGPGIAPSYLESYCIGPNLFVIPRNGHFEVSPNGEEREKVDSHYYFWLMSIVWAWFFYSSGEVWKHMEGRFLKSLQNSKDPQKMILKNTGKCRLYLIKHLSVLVLAILQLILFMMVTSSVLMGETEEKRIKKDIENEYEYVDLEKEGVENTKSAWIAIANGERVLHPSIAGCLYHTSSW